MVGKAAETVLSDQICLELYKETKIIEIGPILKKELEF